MVIKLTLQEINQLATFNAERARGIVHTLAWIDKMLELQDRFYTEQRLARAAEGRL